MTDTITLPRKLAEAIEQSLGSFVSDHGWSQHDMDNMDSLSAALAQQADQSDVGINGLTDAETRATMSVIGLSNPAKLTAYERKCFNDWKNP